MSSTDLEAPPLRLTLAAIIVVVGLHILTAIALVAIKTPELKIEAKKDTPPIEIELVSLPAAPEAEVSEVTPKQEPAPQVVKQQPETAKSIVPPKPEAPAKPVVREEKKLVKTESEAPNLEEPRTLSSSNNRPLNDPPPKSKRDSFNETNTSKLGGLVDNSSTTIVGKEPVTSNNPVRGVNKNEGSGENKPVESGSTSTVNTQTTNTNQVSAPPSTPVDTGPVSFSASNASWRSGREPDLSFLKNEARNLTKDVSVKVKITVDEKGNIVGADLLSGTGNKRIDREISRAVKRAKLNPYIKNGVAVKGTVTLPIVYNVN